MGKKLKNRLFFHFLIFLPKNLTEHFQNYALQDKNKYNGGPSKKDIYSSI